MGVSLATLTPNSESGSLRFRRLKGKSGRARIVPSEVRPQINSLASRKAAFAQFGFTTSKLILALFLLLEENAVPW
jgi:hypothetical protein